MAVNKVIYGDTPIIDLTGDTAEAADVASGKIFHNKAGIQQTGTASIVTPTIITPSNSTPPSIAANGIYKPSASGYAISSYSSVTPSGSGAAFNSGMVKMSSSGYAYSSKPVIQAESIRLTYKTSKSANDTGTVSQLSYTVSDTSDYAYYFVLGIAGGTNTNVSAGSLDAFNGITVSNNGRSVPVDKILDDTNTYSNTGFKIYASRVMAVRNDGVITVNTVNGKSVKGCSTNIYIFRIFIASKNIQYTDDNTRLQMLAYSGRTLNDPINYQPPIQSVVSHKCFGLLLVRGNANKFSNLEWYSPNHGIHCDESVITASNSGTSWYIRCGYFYPQMYYGLDNWSSQFRVKTSSSGSNFVTGCVIIEVI